MAAEFRTALDTRLVNEIDDTHQLLADFVFFSELMGREIVVPKDFITDFASVPRLPFAYMVVGGKGKKAAVIHDWLYSGGLVGDWPLDQLTCDKIFAEALKASGYGWLVENLMYAGVRIGGEKYFKGPNVPQEAHVLVDMAPTPG